MTLRTKFLALFLCLGTLPLLGLGVLAYVESTRALERLLADQTAAIARRAAEELTHRYALSVSDLRFLAENAESRRLLIQREPHGEVLPDSERQGAESFLDEAWAAVGESWRWAQLRGSAGELVYRWGSDGEGSVFELLDGQAAATPEHVVTRPVLGVGRGLEQEIGSIRGSLVVNDVLPRSELGVVFGEAGYSVVIDRGPGEVSFLAPSLELCSVRPATRSSSIAGRGRFCSTPRQDLVGAPSGPWTGWAIGDSTPGRGPPLRGFSPIQRTVWTAWPRT
jgi:hypothetical protein